MPTDGRSVIPQLPRIMLPDVPRIETPRLCCAFIRGTISKRPPRCGPTRRSALHRRHALDGATIVGAHPRLHRPLARDAIRLLGDRRQSDGHIRRRGRVRGLQARHRSVDAGRSGNRMGARAERPRQTVRYRSGASRRRVGRSSARVVANGLLDRRGKPDIDSDCGEMRIRRVRAVDAFGKRTSSSSSVTQARRPRRPLEGGRAFSGI